MSRALLAAVLLTAVQASATPPASSGVPVIVAAVDIPAGTVVTMEMVSQRSVPAANATASVVKPDSASYIINQRLLFPVLAGDLLLWSFFETRKNPTPGCAALYKTGADARKDLARAKRRLTKR